MSNTENKTAVIVSIKSTKLSSELLQLETGVRTAQASFVIMGRFLTQIHDNELYTERHFTTWTDYIAEMFDMTRDYSYKIMNSYAVIEILKSSGFKGAKLPKTESQARPLARLLDSQENNDDILKAWGNVTDKYSKVTAKVIQEEVNKVTGKQAPTPKTPADKDKKINVPNNVGDIDQTPANKEEIGAELDKMIAHNIELTQKLETVKRDTVEIPRHKLAIKLYKAGFKALTASIDKTDTEALADLLDLKTILLG